MSPFPANLNLLQNHFTSTTPPSKQNFDTSNFWLIKISTNGDILWEKTFGSEGNETLADIKQTPDDGFFMVGSINDCETLYYIKTDANGTL